MTGSYGAQAMGGRLRWVLVKRPDEAFAVEDSAKWHYTSSPNLEVAREEHDRFVDILRLSGAEVIYHDCLQPDRADAIYVHDPAIITDRGAIILRMGKALRRGEEEAIEKKLAEIGVPILYRMHGEATAEGGDLLWIDHDTLAVGQGFRTNREGLRQLREALLPLGIKIIPIPLVYFYGPAACLHLMSFVSIVGERTAVVYPPLMPVPFWQELQNRGFRFVEVPDEEFLTMGSNVLSLTPMSCVMLEGSPLTKERLAHAGFEVFTYKGNEISLKAEGGPTCLTRPIWRE
ncbi:MAG: arginine deiminase family protein [Candidatus Bipolaricaulota bacterium]|nr:arginine deiminase family protein [Candidatus Bipolaricaulota bacterium]